MIEIKCNNSKFKSVIFWRNGGREDQVMVFAMEENEYWFTIGTYNSLRNAKKGAVKAMGDHGYTFDPVELKTLNFVD